MTKFKELGEVEAIRQAEGDGIIIHRFVDPVDCYQNTMVIRRNSKINNAPNIFELFIETSTGGYLSCPDLNTDEMDDYLVGTGLNQDKLVELCDGFNLW